MGAGPDADAKARGLVHRTPRAPRHLLTLLSVPCTRQPGPREGQAGPAGWRMGPYY